MQGLTQEEERFRVLLMGMEEDTVEHREIFCRDFSKKYNLSFALLRNVIDRCPVVLRKNISLKKAEALAKVLKQFGALVSVEGNKQGPLIRLEFQDLGPSVLALEDSRFRKKQNGMWTVTGKVKNISTIRIADLWVLVQLFGPDGELITFEEVPLPINPLFPRMSCPFKVLLEGSAVITNLSIAFKNAEGNPLSASDGRHPEGQTRDRPAEDDPVGFSTAAELQAPLEESSVEETTSPATSENVRVETAASSAEDLQGSRQGGEAAELIDAMPTEGDTAAIGSRISEEPPGSCSSTEVAGGLERGDFEMIGIVFPELNTPLSSEKATEEKTPEEASPLEEASQILGEISNGDQDPDPRQETGEKTEAPFEGHIEQSSPIEENGLSVVSWIEPFRDSVEAFYTHHPDPFQQWFRSRQAEKKFEGEFHTLVTILLHARFDQMTASVKALENTERVYPLMTRPSLAVEEIPALEGTLRLPGDDWKMLFHKAIPRLREVAQHILAGQGWNVTDLEQLLQVIPHMGRQTSRRATKWIRALMAGIVQIDLSQARVLVGEPLYRVAARLGVVDPLSDGWEGPKAMGDLKIQSFARTAFPEDILRIEDPMEWVGNLSEEERHCVPIDPRCEGCLFDGFCPKLYDRTDPCERGMAKA